MADDIVQVMANTRADATTLQIVVNGDENTQVTSRLGESYPSVQKAIKLMTQSGLSFTAFETKSLMTASSLANGSYAIVTNDTTTNNGLHLKKSGSWSKVSYDVDERQKTYTDVAANAALVSAKAYADGVGTAAVSQLKTYTDGKKTDAVNESKFYTDNQSTATLNAAKTDATNKAESVRLSAITSAATDATTKANTALASAKTYADGVGTAAVSQLKTYTDGKKTDAVNESKFYADNQDTVTLNAAKLDATNKAESVKVSAATDATTKANAAKTAAISAASSDATTKSSAAQTAAITAAATDATTKASAAKDAAIIAAASDATAKSNAAITTAATDATEKAGAALASSKTYTDTKAGEALTKANEAADMADAVDLTIKSITSSETDRVGDAPELFSDVIKAEPDPIILGSQLYISQISKIGKVLTVKDKAGYIATRKAVPVYSSHSYSLSASLLRVVNPTDPLNDTVEVGVEWLNQAKQSISHQVISSLTLDSADGVTVIDEPIFPTATSAYVRAWFRIYGSDSETALIYLSIDDVTVEKVLGDNISQSASDALSDAKDYTDAAKTEVNNYTDTAVDSLGIRSEKGALSFAVIDKNRNLTDIQLNDEGQFTDEVIQSFSERLEIDAKAEQTKTEVKNYTDAEINKLGIGDNISSLSFAVVDKNNNLTDIQLNDEGQFTDVVVQSLTSRMGLKQPVDQYFDGNKLLPVNPDKNKMVLLGSSSLDHMQTHLTPMLKGLNADIDVAAPCFSSAKINQMSAMLGSIPLKLSVSGGVISASGGTAVTITNGVTIHAARMKFWGWLSGVYGQITAQSDGYSATFTRAESGSEVQVTDDVDFIPELTQTHRDAVQVVWIGKNNLTNGVPSINSLETILSETDKMITFARNFNKRVVVMTHFVNTDTPAVSATRDRIGACNAAYFEKYGDAVFDANAILLSPDIWTDLNITPTATDIEQQNLGNLAPSLSQDPLHTNPITSNYIAQKLVDFIKHKQWY